MPVTYFVSTGSVKLADRPNTSNRTQWPSVSAPERSLPASPARLMQFRRHMVCGLMRKPILDCREDCAVRDYYAILGVPRTATAAEIDAAFRTLARSCHPDLRPEEEERNATAEFKLATEAHEVLSNIEKRREYDRASPKRPVSALVSPFSSRPTKSKPVGEPVQGPLDVEAELHLVPEEANRGSLLELRISVPAPCHCCRRQLDPTCQVCGGKGTATESRIIHLQVPAGLHDGEVLCMPGFGRAVSLGGPKGDLYLRIRVRPCW